MKLIHTLTAIAALAALTTTAALASPTNWPPTAPSNPAAREVTTPSAPMKCDTMTVTGGGRSGQQVVACKNYAAVRPTECRMACANK